MKMETSLNGIRHRPLIHPVMQPAGITIKIHRDNLFDRLVGLTNIIVKAAALTERPKYIEVLR